MNVLSLDQLSIRYKLVVLLGLSLGLGLLVSSLVALYSTFAAERQSSLRALHQIAAITSENMRAALAFHDAQSADKMLAALHTNPHIHYAFVENEHGQLLSQYLAPAMPASAAKAWQARIKPLMAPQAGVHEGMERTHHYVLYPITLDDTHLGTLALLADNDAMYAKMRSFMWLQGGASLLIFASLLLLSWRLQLIFTRPMLQLLASMRRIGHSKDYTATLGTLRTDEFGELYRGFNAMLHEIRQRDELLSRLATTDALTGLANRGHALETLQAMATRAQRKHESMGVILLDVDHFKQVNDQHGHPAGDQVLQEIARILQAGIRTYDLAARYGGEEFLLLCDGADLATTTEIAERIRASVASHRFVLAQGPQLQVTVSLGLHVGSARADAAMALIEAADQALYRAKQAGRNRVESA
ncbi:diguanylate cyclase [Acidovorax sp. HDW3]|uniref:sensor domain-containing diguanylate cyclase n=1 Tax=Acidovorax sp. HDW3 TaxID=2714923 RepID=UPI00140E3DA2|nr:sensor domain-containing diguanylate cyclase [Acidovorax sp. HDW3]QIL43262.1 diguanylate cyclase [Acidovorax sp. HDW3]